MRVLVNDFIFFLLKIKFKRFHERSLFIEYNNFSFFDIYFQTPISAVFLQSISLLVSSFISFLLNVKFKIFHEHSLFIEYNDFSCLDIHVPNSNLGSVSLKHQFFVVILYCNSGKNAKSAAKGICCVGYSLFAVVTNAGGMLFINKLKIIVLNGPSCLGPTVVFNSFVTRSL